MQRPIVSRAPRLNRLGRVFGGTQRRGEVVTSPHLGSAGFMRVLRRPTVRPASGSRSALTSQRTTGRDSAKTRRTRCSSPSRPTPTTPARGAAASSGDLPSSRVTRRRRRRTRGGEGGGERGRVWGERRGGGEADWGGGGGGTERGGGGGGRRRERPWPRGGGRAPGEDGRRVCLQGRFHNVVA